MSGEDGRLSDILFQNSNLALRRMRDDVDDYSWMMKWLTDPRVLEFYDGRDKPHTLESIQHKYRPRINGEHPVVPCMILYDGRPIGYLQFYRLAEVLSETDKRAYGTLGTNGNYGFDIFIGECDYWNRGIGTRAVRALQVYLFNELHAGVITVPPHVQNARAIRCYEKAGFRKIKVLPRHELHEGEYRDSLLMAIARPRQALVCLE